MSDTPLAALLKLAGINPGQRATWFTGCTLVGLVLFVPTKDQGETIARLFGPTLKAVRPTLAMKVATPQPQPPSYLNAAGRKAWKGEQREAQAQRLPD